MEEIGNIVPFRGSMGEDVGVVTFEKGGIRWFVQQLDRALALFQT